MPEPRLAYGMLGSADRPAAAGPRVPPGVAPASGESAQSLPAVTAPMERARSLEQQVQRDAQDLNRRIDEQTK